MLRTPLRLVAATIVALSLTSAPAHAARKVIKDPTGDVYTSTIEGANPVLLGARVNVDVKKTVIKHDRRTLSAKVSYVDLVKNPDVIGFGVIIRTSSGQTRQATFFAMPRKRKGIAQLMTLKAKELPCKGIRHMIDYGRNTVSIEVPRTCLGNPKWVKVQLAAIATTTEFTSMDVDDAQRPDVIAGNSWSNKIKAG